MYKDEFVCMGNCLSVLLQQFCGEKLAYNSIIVKVTLQLKKGMQDSQWYPLNWFFWKLMKFFFWLFFLSWKSFREIQKLKIFLKFFILVHTTHLWPFSKSKFNLKSDRVNLVAPASPIECLLYLPNVRVIQYKLEPER